MAVENRVVLHLLWPLATGAENAYENRSGSLMTSLDFNGGNFRLLTGNHTAGMWHYIDRTLDRYLMLYV